MAFEESRRHPGIETNRNWSDKAVNRTTPCLFGLFGWIAMTANELRQAGKLKVRSAA